MFEDLLENMKEQETALRQKLVDTIVEEELQGVRIQGNANLDIHAVEVDEAYFNRDKKEELEDVLVACLTNWKAKAEHEANQVSAGLVDGMLPPGFDDLLNQMK